MTDLSREQTEELIVRAQQTSDALVVGASRSDAYDAEMLCADADLFSELADAIRQLLNPWKGIESAHPAISAYQDDSGSGYDVDLTKLPKEITILRFWNSWL